MPEIGTVLQNMGSPYRAYRDEYGTWRIVDLLDKSLEKFDPDDDIPDSHPAVTVIPEAAFFELVKKANSLGLIQKLNFSDNDEDKEKLRDEVYVLQLENGRLKLELEDTKKKEPTSESYKLKLKIIDSILKVGVVDALQNEN